MRKTLVLSILLVILLASCTVTEDLTISDGASSSSSDINVQQFFVDVIQDYSQFMPSGSENIMDSAIRTFAGQIEDAEAGWNTVFIKDGENSYTGVFNFSSIETLADELGGGSQSIITQTGNSLTFNCNIDNYKELENIVPFLADPNISVYLAEYNIGYSEQDYMDMITFAIGAEAPEALRSSMIEINITVPGSITSISGAVKTGDNTLTFSFPLIDFLLLAEPLAFSVQWS